MKFLIIDDERAIRTSFADLMMIEGYEIDQAEDGAVGVAMAEKEHYDLIFCDVKMPNMTGQEVLDALTEKGIDSPVIMISGHGGIETAVECIKKGAFDFIEKPFTGPNMNRLFIAIRNAT